MVGMGLAPLQCSPTRRLWGDLGCWPVAILEVGGVTQVNCRSAFFFIRLICSGCTTLWKMSTPSQHHPENGEIECRELKNYRETQEISRSAGWWKLSPELRHWPGKWGYDDDIRDRPPIMYLYNLDCPMCTQRLLSFPHIIMPILDWAWPGVAGCPSQRNPGLGVDSSHLVSWHSCPLTHWQCKVNALSLELWISFIVSVRSSLIYQGYRGGFQPNPCNIAYLGMMSSIVNNQWTSIYPWMHPGHFLTDVQRTAH